MTKPAKRRRSKKRRPDFFLKNRFLLLLLAVAGLAVFSLVWFARMEEQPAQPVALPPVVKPPVDYTVTVRAEVESLLSSLGVDGVDIQRDLALKPSRYTIKGEFPSAESIAAFRESLSRISGGYSVKYREANSLAIEKARRTQIIIHFLPPVPAFPSGPLLTIIMDDLGRSTATAKALIAMSQRVTFAIIPGEPQSVQVAELAHAAGREVLLHVPMEPQAYPAVNPGADALFIKYDAAEIRSRLDQFLVKIPYVTGVNNHMGSRFTEVSAALRPVMESLQEKGLFFIDSRTTGRSQVTAVAHQFNVPTMNRDVFLDNVAEVDAIVREIRRLEGKAVKNGMAIGICHPYPETLEALRRELPGLAQRGISVVPVSTLLEKRAFGQGS